MSLVRKSFKKIGEISFWLIHLVGYEWWASSKKYYGKAEWEEINRVFWCIVIAITFTTTVRTKVRRTRTHIRYEDLNCLAQYLIGFCWSWQIIQMTDFECTKHTKKKRERRERLREFIQAIILIILQTTGMSSTSVIISFIELYNISLSLIKCLNLWYQNKFILSNCLSFQLKVRFIIYIFVW